MGKWLELIVVDSRVVLGDFGIRLRKNTKEN